MPCHWKFLPLSFLFAVIAPGCGRRAQTAALPPKPKPKPEISEIDLKSYKPNEAGSIMIPMFHRFNAKEKPSDLNRTPDEFRKDLENLY